jgi:hypothetical protein
VDIITDTRGVILRRVLAITTAIRHGRGAWFFTPRKISALTITPPTGSAAPLAPRQCS